jgi:DNA-binding PadR family transcriptional regulator
MLALGGVDMPGWRAIHYGLVSGADKRVMGLHGKFDGLGRFADPSLLVLTSLSGGPKHGYAIMTDVAAFSGVGMEPGTLYGALSRLERRGWVRPLAAAGRRRPYEITAAGEAVLAGQLKSMQQIVRVGRQRAITAWET